jgi:phosphate transport system substrate-binding protein
MHLIQIFRRPATGALVALALAACGGAASNSPTPAPSADVGSGNLTGAGATFPEPFYTKAFYTYNQQHSQVSVNYQAVGSGAGIQQYTKGTVDFGASDVPMTDAEVTAAGGADSLVEIPTILGVEAIAYNLQGVDSLKIDGPTLASIYLGHIKTWNDPALTALNPGAKLPSSNITVVHRSDGSGTTYAFTDYLAKVSPEWKSKVGTAKSVQWPAGIGGSGNAGVGNAVKQTDASIGYVELAYVVQSQLQYMQMKNQAGNWVKPSADTATAAAASISSVSPTNFSITDAPGAQAYPITTYSWLIIKKAQTDPVKGRALVYLFQWLTSPSGGQSLGKDLSYAELPKNAQDYGLSQLKLITAGGQPILR